MDLLFCLTAFGISAFFCIQFVRREHAPRTHALIKCVPSLCCCLLALYGVLHSGRSGADGILICCGLLVCTLADWTLEFHFLPGAGLFILAHLCFTAGFAVLSGKLPNVFCFLIVLGVLYLLLALVKPAGAPRASVLPIILYIAVISLMTAAAVNCGALFAVGAFLFVQSDALLGARLLGRIKGASVSWAIMGPYYLALYFIALGCVFGL